MSAKVKKSLETLSTISTVGVSATEAARASQLCRSVSNDPEASQDTKARAAYFAAELAHVPDTGAAERREILVGKAAAFAAVTGPTA